MIISVLILIVFFVFLVPIPVGFSSLFLMAFSEKKNIYLFYILFCIGTSLVCLFYVPNYTDDLSRYYIVMRLMKPLSSWSEFINFSQSNSALQYQGTNKIFNIIEYLIARTGKFSLLPFVSTLVCYLSVLFPIVDLKRNTKIRSTTTLTLAVCLLLLFNLNFTANTMRWAMASAIFGLVSYLYFVKLNKLVYIWILAIPLLFHVGIILAVTLAIFVAIVRKTSIFSYAILLIGFIMFWIYAIKNGSLEVSGTFSQITSMANTYSTDFMNRNLNGTIILYLSRAADILMLSAAVIIYFGKPKINRDSFDRLCLLQFFFGIMLFNNSMIFNRYLLIISILSIISIGKNIVTVKINRVQLGMFMIAVSLLILCVTAYAGCKDMNFTVSKLNLIFMNILKAFINLPIF